MARHFDTSPPGRMNFREISQEVRRRSGNRSKPSDIQIVNAIGQNAVRPHSLVPEAFKHLAWDGSNTISTEDAERWMTEHLVPYFEALQAEWNDRREFRGRRKGFQRDRLAYMRKVGYAAFEAEFRALHAERYTRRDVDGWLLKRYAYTRNDIPEPEVAIPEKTKSFAETVTRDTVARRWNAKAGRAETLDEAWERVQGGITPKPATVFPNVAPPSQPAIGVPASKPDPERSIVCDWSRGWSKFWKARMIGKPLWVTKLRMKGDTELRLFGDNFEITRDDIWIGGVRLRFHVSSNNPRYCEANLAPELGRTIRK